MTLVAGATSGTAIVRKLLDGSNGLTRRPEGSREDKGRKQIQNALAGGLREFLVRLW
jgi:hypothetical protein